MPHKTLLNTAKSTTVFLLIFGTTLVYGQRENHLDLSFANGSSINTLSVNVVKNFKLLKSERLRLGVGGRGGYLFGTTTEYYTAPAKHNKSKDGIDTLFAAKPQFFSFNISFNAEFVITPAISICGNLDFAGFTFGKKREVEFRPGLLAQNEDAPREALNNAGVKPMRNNIYLTGNYNKGTLISEVFLRITPVERVSLKAGISNSISEYASQNRIGYKDNYRFRNSSIQWVFGIGWNFI
ncbi:MAG: hypothetical protein H6605_01365 [Flavobacteriales bacterium]|nr:hypothetical protein [Flavobacteriales bacterium]